MGEAIYTMVCKWDTEAQAKEAEPEIKEFLQKMHEAENAWQDGRGFRPDKSKSSDAKLRKQFADVFEALGIPLPEEDDQSMNHLAGLLDSPVGCDYRFTRKKYIITFSGMVWHFADWGPLARVMKEKFGAINVKYWSDEYVQEILSEIRSQWTLREEGQSDA